MNPSYKPLRQQADKLFYKFQDIVDDRSDPLVNTVHREMQEIVRDFDNNKTPQTAEDRIRRVQQMMEKVRNGQSRMMTPEDARFMINEYEQLRRLVRQLPNY